MRYSIAATMVAAYLSASTEAITLKQDQASGDMSGQMGGMGPMPAMDTTTAA